MFKVSEEQEPTEKRASISRLFSRVQSLFVCGQCDSYDLEKKRKEFSCERYSRQTFLPPKDELFLMALYKDGLLKRNIIIKDGSKKSNLEVLVVFVKFNHPVIEICMGFTNNELRSSNRPEKYLDMPNNYTDIDGTCRVQVGINRVLFGKDNADYGARFDGFPAAMWFDVYDPAIEQFLLMKFRNKRNRSIFTRRGQNKLIRPPTNPPMLMGDVVEGGYMGPLFFEDAVNMQGERIRIAFLAHRIGELGERQRLRRITHGISAVDPQVMNVTMNDREFNHHFPRRPRLPSHDVRRSGSNPVQPDNIERPHFPHDDYVYSDAYNF